MTAAQEEIFISVIMDHFNVIERKSTDKSLTPKKLAATLLQEWTKIQSELSQRIGVRFV